LHRSGETLPGDNSGFRVNLQTNYRFLWYPNPGVCRASRVKTQKITDQVIFYPANSESNLIIVVFLTFFKEKIRKTYKCNGLLGDTGWI
jgi:hypothetical protein